MYFYLTMYDNQCIHLVQFVDAAEQVLVVKLKLQVVAIVLINYWTCKHIKLVVVSGKVAD